jgi:hypothetical protein
MGLPAPTIRSFCIVLYALTYRVRSAKLVRGPKLQGQ